MKLHPRRQPRKEVAEPQEGGVRGSGGVGGVEQARGKLGEELAAPLGTGGIDMAVMPRTDGRGHLWRVGKAHPSECGEGLRIILNPGKDQAAKG